MAQLLTMQEHIRTLIVFQGLMVILVCCMVVHLLKAVQRVVRLVRIRIPLLSIVQVMGRHIIICNHGLQYMCGKELLNRCGAICKQLNMVASYYAKHLHQHYLLLQYGYGLQHYSFRAGWLYSNCLSLIMLRYRPSRYLRQRYAYACPYC